MQVGDKDPTKQHITAFHFIPVHPTSTSAISVPPYSQPPLLQSHFTCSLGSAILFEAVAVVPFVVG